MGAAEEAKPTGIARSGIVLGTVLAVMVQNLDATIAAVALPHMQGSLSASQDEISWVITSYIVAVAIMTAPAGWLANRYGRKRTLIVSLAGFTLASMATGFAQSLDQVVLFRFLQGLFGAPMVPLSQSLLLDTYEPKDSVRALSWWSLGSIIGPIIGPNLGGWITENWDWRWVFFINAPIGALGLAFLGAFVPETSKRRVAFDWFGFLALSLFLITFQLVMDRGSEKDWFGSREIITEPCLGCLGMYVFVVHSLTSKSPLIDFSSLRDPNFTLGTLYVFLNSIIIMVGIVLIPAFLQEVVGDPVGFSGTIMAPRAIGGGIALIVLGRIPKNIDPRIVAVAGLGIAAGATFYMAGWNANVSAFEVAYNGFLQGFGVTIAFLPVQMVTFARISPVQRNGAATLFGLTRNFGQSIGVSAATAMLVHNIQVNHADIAAHVTPFNRALHSGSAGQFWDLGRSAGRMSIEAEIGRQATTIAYVDDFKMLFYVAAAGFPLILTLRLPKKPG